MTGARPCVRPFNNGGETVGASCRWKDAIKTVFSAAKRGCLKSQFKRKATAKGVKSISHYSFANFLRLKNLFLLSTVQDVIFRITINRLKDKFVGLLV
jgi:hypothetical protein